MDKVSDERLASVPPPANKDEEIASLKRAMMYWNERAERAEVELAALRAAQGEPVAWQDVYDNTDLYYRKPVQGDVRPLYAAPPASAARIAELEEALRGLDPYLDQLVCFASTPQEYKPNRAIANARRALAGEGGKG